MDVTRVLTVTIDSRGHHLQTARLVDTEAQADAIARAGRALDEVDGARTTYRLRTWQHLPDRARLVAECVWPPREETDAAS